MGKSPDGSNFSPIERERWAALAKEHMHDMSDQLFVAFEKFFLTSKEVKENKTVEIWSFSTSIFFAVTVVTTIGFSLLPRQGF